MIEAQKRIDPISIGFQLGAELESSALISSNNNKSEIKPDMEESRSLRSLKMMLNQGRRTSVTKTSLLSVGMIILFTLLISDCKVLGSHLHSTSSSSDPSLQLQLHQKSHHNNFVGIVYDLRDTEYGYLLEARRVSETIESFAKPSTKTTASALINDDNHADDTLLTSSSLAPDSGVFQSRLNNEVSIPSSKSDEKYVISSSHLFNSVQQQQQQQFHSSTPDLPLESSSNGLEIVSSSSPTRIQYQQDAKTTLPSSSWSSVSALRLSSEADQVQLSLAESPRNSNGEPEMIFIQQASSTQAPSYNQFTPEQQQQHESFDATSTQAQTNKTELKTDVPMLIELAEQTNSTLPGNQLQANNLPSYNVVGSASSSNGEANGASNSLDILANMSSAHSPPASLLQHKKDEDQSVSTIPQQATSQEMPKEDKMTTLGHTNNESTLSTVSLSHEASNPLNPSSIAPSQLMSLISVVNPMANNELTNNSNLVAHQEQEFTLSTLSQPVVEFVDLISSPNMQSTTTGKIAITSGADSPSSESDNHPQSTTLHLIQTTTPFTTSLSTAQIPVLSQHSSIATPSSSSSQQHLTSSPSSYSSQPNSFTPTPAALFPQTSQSFDETSLSNSNNNSLSSQQSTAPTSNPSESSTTQKNQYNANTNTLVSSPPTSPSSTSSSGPNQQFVTSSSPGGSTSFSSKPAGYHYPPSSSSSSQIPSQLAASFGYGQLYASHHSQSSTSNHHHSQNYLPSGGFHKNNASPLGQQGLVASTKTVSPSQPGNNLIPNLSHLQSAILSHIPFKLASGLSSGLTSYLTAAMKPNGGRPLIASNTAVAHQFGQSGDHTTSKPTPTPSSSPVVRFPSTQSQTPETSASASSTQEASSTSESSTNSHPTPSTLSESASTSSSPNNASVAPQPLMGWPLNSLIKASVSHFGLSTGHHHQQSSRDAALQVCGRPQAGPAALGPYSSSQAAALAVSSNAEAKKRVARIVGGNQSIFGQWPWIVSLRQWRKGAFLHKCGAALLNDNWAITAAHCVESVKPSDLLLRLGEFDVSNQNEPYPYVERRVKTIVSHPLFDPKTFEYDLALLKFAEPIRYERNILPVCVPSGNDSYVDRIATVIGWGRLYEDGPLPDIIQHVDVPIITNQECEHMYKKAGFVEEIPDIFICAGITKGGRDSCEGDSGGPLTMVDNDGRAYLVGIISWGIGCALPSQPGVYTRITTFASWINEIVNM